MNKSPKLSNLPIVKDQQGYWAIWQWPNIPLYGWMVCELLSVIVKQHPWHGGLALLSRAFLFTWAYLEVTDGVNYFRRLLGFIVITGITVSYFK